MTDSTTADDINRRAILFPVLLLLVFAQGCVLEHGSIAGRVVDCASKAPVANAKIEVNASDWGISGGGVVWDKNYSYSATTDAQGGFRLDYRHDHYAHLKVVKAGYRFTLMDTASNDRLEVGMLPGQETAWSRSCRPSEDCLKSWTENNVQVTTDVCAQ